MLPWGQIRVCRNPVTRSFKLFSAKKVPPAISVCYIGNVKGRISFSCLAFCLTICLLAPIPAFTFWTEPDPEIYNSPNAVTKHPKAFRLNDEFFKTFNVQPFKLDSVSLKKVKIYRLILDDPGMRVVSRVWTFEIRKGLFSKCSVKATRAGPGGHYSYSVSDKGCSLKQLLEKVEAFHLKHKFKKPEPAGMVSHYFNVIIESAGPRGYNCIFRPGIYGERHEPEFEVWVQELDKPPPGAQGKWHKNN